MKSTFSILFFARWDLQKGKTKKVPISASVTVDGERVKFSLKTEISPKLWDKKAGRAMGQSREAQG